jgi:type II secretory pathway component PulF
MEYSSNMSVAVVLDCLRLLGGLLGQPENSLKLPAVGRDAESRSVLAILQQLTADIKRGISLHNSLQAAGFSAEVCNMLSIAEKKGEINSALSRLTAYYKSRLCLQGVCARALFYPLVVLNILLFLVSAAAFYIGPAMGEYQLMANPDAGLGLVLAFWKILYFLTPFLFLAALGVAFLLILFAFGRRRLLYRVFEPLFLFLPWYGRALRYEAAANLTWALSVSAESGQSLADGLKRLQKEHPSARLSKLAASLQNNISRGLSMAEVLKKDPFLPLSLRFLLIAGEEGGELSASLKTGTQIAEAEIPVLLADSEKMLSLLFLLGAGFITGVALILIFYPLGRLV